MASRTVKDSSGRTWTCTSSPTDAAATADLLGRDVVLHCTSDAVAEPVTVTASWQWEKMADNGLARLVSQAVPVVPKR